MTVTFKPPSDRPRRALPFRPLSQARQAPAAPDIVIAPPPHLERLSEQPPAQLGPASPNFLQRPSGMAARTVDRFLTVPERVNLASTSLRMRREIRESAGFKESVLFARTRRALLSARRDYQASNRRDAGAHAISSDRLRAAEAQYEQTCISIVEARAARGILQPLYPAFRQATHLLAHWPTVTSTMLLDSEAVLVEAADRASPASGDYARRLHNDIWELNDLEHTQPRNDDAVDKARRSIKGLLKSLARHSVDAMTEDLRLPRDPVEPGRPEHRIAFVDHFADESWTPGKTVTQSHTDPAGNTTTQVLPWPNPAEGITRLRFQFKPTFVGGRVYVHTFNVPYTDVGMEAID